MPPRKKTKTAAVATCHDRRRGERLSDARIVVLLFALATAEPGTPADKIAVRVDVSVSSVYKYRRAVLKHHGSTTLSVANIEQLLPRLLPARGGARAACTKWAGERTATALRDAVASAPDATLVELCAQLRAEHGVDVHCSTMCRWVNQRLALRRHVAATVAPARRTARVLALREAFSRLVQPRLANLLARGLVFFCDESHFDRRSGARVHARAPPGQRAVLERAANGGAQRERHTLLRAVGTGAPAGGNGHALVTANAVITGGSNDAATFVHFIDTQLGPLAHEMRVADARRHGAPLPSLPPGAPAAAAARQKVLLPVTYGSAARRKAGTGRTVRSFTHGREALAAAGGGRSGAPAPAASARARAAAGAATDTTTPPVTVLLDNWRGHHSALVREALARWEGTLRAEFVPPYSPDLNWPIECSFHDIKGALRRSAHAVGTLDDAVLERVVAECDTGAERSTASALTLLRRARHAGYTVGDAWIDSGLARVAL